MSKHAILLILLIALSCANSCTAILAVPPDTDSGIDPILNSPRNPFAIHPNDYLSERNFSSLLVEVDYISGCVPSESALFGLKQILEKYCAKPDGIRVALNDEIPLPDSWAGTEDEITALSEKYKNLPVQTGTARAYIIYVPDIKFAQSKWGELWGYSCPERGFICISSNRIQSSAFMYMTAEKIEKRVLVHEFGHLLGLISNPFHQTMADHCVNPDCVMCKDFDRVFMANFVEIVLTGNTPDDYCEECRKDLDKYKLLKVLPPFSH
ncbi:MAG: hypothetical protein HZA48_03195 [Planctomycetes bacterium]|nr:hypothetical protein [Planctomycetota bacterium]